MERDRGYFIPDDDPSFCLTCTVAAKHCRGKCRSFDDREKVMRGESLVPYVPKIKKKGHYNTGPHVSVNPCTRCAPESWRVCKRTGSTCNAKARWEEEQEGTAGASPRPTMDTV